MVVDIYGIEPCNLIKEALFWNFLLWCLIHFVAFLLDFDNKILDDAY